MASVGKYNSDPEYADSAGQVLSALANDELQQERRRKDSIEQRGITVITSAGVLVTLLLAFAGIAGTDQLHALSPLGRDLMGGSLLLFAISAVLGLLANTVAQYTEAKVSTLQNLIENYWDYPASDAAKEVAVIHAKSATSARAKNDTKAQLLRWAIIAEVCAVVLLAAGATVALGIFGLH